MNQFYLRRHQTPNASYARKRILFLPSLIQRRRGKSTILSSTSLLLLDRTLLWRKCKYEASRSRPQLKEGPDQGGRKRNGQRVVSKARVLTVGEGITMVEMDRASVSMANKMSVGRGNLKRPSVTQTDDSCPHDIRATSRRARLRFEAAVTPLSS